MARLSIASAIHGFKVLADTYLDMRDIGFQDEEKKIDEAYSEINHLRTKLAAKQAGGKSKTRKHRHN